MISLRTCRKGQIVEGVAEHAADPAWFLRGREDTLSLTRTRREDLPFRVLSDLEDHANARRFLCFDDFEDLELHPTNLIDREGRLRWARTGGDPFMDMDFLLKEIDRIERLERQGRLDPARTGGGQK